MVPAWPDDRLYADLVPDVVDERVVIIPHHCRIGVSMPRDPPQRPLQIVLLTGHDWMTDDTFAAYGPGRRDYPWVCKGSCYTGKNCSRLDSEQDQEQPCSGWPPTIVLVGLDEHLRQHWPVRDGMPSGLVSDVGQQAKRSVEMVARHIKFYTADEYSAEVGGEQYLLETTPPSRVDV